MANVAQGLETRIRDTSSINQCDDLELGPVCQKCRLEVPGKPGANPELTQHRARRQVHLLGAIGQSKG